jgi:hypothetical protein
MDQATHNKIVVSSGNQVVAQLHLSEASHRLAVDRELPRPSRPETLAPVTLPLVLHATEANVRWTPISPPPHPCSAAHTVRESNDLFRSFPRSVNNGRSHPQGQSR